jgi:hypothetical protein
VKRAVRAARLVARDGRIPRPLRGLAAFSLLPIPGPLDEAMLLLVAGVFWAFYRDELAAAWAQAS